MKFTRAGKEPAYVWFLLRRGVRFAAELWSPRRFATRRHESADAARDTAWSARNRARSPSVKWARALITHVTIKNYGISIWQRHMRRLAHRPKIHFSLCDQRGTIHFSSYIINLNHLIIYRSSSR